MAIEGNDWWALAGAAAAGGILGGIAGKSMQKTLHFTGYRRWYIRQVQKSDVTFKRVMFDVLLHRAMMTLLVNDEGYPVLRLYEWVEKKDTAVTKEMEFWNLIESGAPFEHEFKGIPEVEPAIEFAENDSAFQELVPLGPWGFIGDHYVPKELGSKRSSKVMR